MPHVEVIIIHEGPQASDPPLTRLLREARGRLIDHQQPLFERAGAAAIRVVAGREDAPPGERFGTRLVRLAAELPDGAGLVVFGSGAVARLGPRDARRLVEAAARPAGAALTNNRYSSDVCAIPDAHRVLRDLPPLPADNALPRWLEERAGIAVEELPGRERLALDLDTPLDVALLALTPRPPRALAALAAEHALAIPRLEELRALAADPQRELLVFGRASSRGLAWLERNVRCRVRFLAEERGLRASSRLAIGGLAAIRRPAPERPPRATLGRLLAWRGPQSLASIVAELADGAILDLRVLLADRLGADEETWPAPEDRFASDLQRADVIDDHWLRALTRSAAVSQQPILLGAHTLLGPGLRQVLRRPSAASPWPRPAPAPQALTTGPVGPSGRPPTLE
jgi:hypothetical protein